MHRNIVLAALAGAAALSACSKEAAKTDSTAVAQTGASASRAAYDPATRTATVVAKDFAFEAPDSIPAGWTKFRMINDGPNIHHMQIVRLDSGKTVADLQSLAPNTPPPQWFVAAGGPNGVDGKLESNATMNLAPGNYVMLCFVDIPEKQPHFMKGMVRPFTVTPSAATGTEPVADVTLSLADFAFTVKSGTLSAGKHVIKVVNDGPQEHEVVLLRFQPGKTMKDLGAWAAKYEGPQPITGLGGVAGILKGSNGYFDVDLTPGNYVFICFAPDPKTKKAHMELGMIKEFSIQ